MHQKETGGHYLDCVVRAGLPEEVTLKLIRKVRVLRHWGKCCRRRGHGASRFCRTLVCGAMKGVGRWASGAGGAEPQASRLAGHCVPFTVPWETTEALSAAHFKLECGDSDHH